MLIPKVALSAETITSTKGSTLCTRVGQRISENYHKERQPAYALLLSGAAALLPQKGHRDAHRKGIHGGPSGKKDCFLYAHHT